ncbi:hypothetical protein BLNAU_2825 [Blattamonas nauphoetae]|uniref:Uncharacterized protein n=1 Tax=Blattamonas nauphoetae TaxID=2049346 RepID=A0ABQ9YES7_9EUKA|nr:hypothetical protein BLNAU_2825 [Blattamonas nauphoetae]
MIVSAFVSLISPLSYGTFVAPFYNLVAGDNLPEMIPQPIPSHLPSQLHLDLFPLSSLLTLSFPSLPTPGLILPPLHRQTRYITPTHLTSNRAILLQQSHSESTQRRELGDRRSGERARHRI